jgi:FkbM family methyltransferase
MANLLRRAKWGLVRVLGDFGFDLERDVRSGRLKLRKRLRLGHDHLKDVATILGRDLRVILDIGANVGQSAVAFRSAFPNARIVSVEPDPGAFEQLRANTATLSGVELLQSAIGDAAGEATFYRHQFDQTNSLLPRAAGADEFVVSAEFMKPIGEITVPVTTVDAICRERGIEEIDFLKSDTQGYEMKVLDGARELLERRAIKAIYVEVCFVPMYEQQPLFQQLYDYLYVRGYRLVGIYESGYATHFYQVGGNALFIREDLGSRHTTGEK